MKMSLVPLTRIFLLQCLLTMMMAMPFADADAQQRRGDHSRGGRSENRFDNQVESLVNAYLDQGDQINLNQSLGLQQILMQGQQILSINVVAQSAQYNSEIILLINGQRIDAQSLSAYTTDIVIHLPVLYQKDKLVLKVKGRAYIHKVSAQLAGLPNDTNSQSDTLRVQLDQPIQRGGVLALRKLIANQHGSGVLMHQKVDKVIMRASSVNGYATAVLLVNGRPVGFQQTIPVVQTRMVFELSKNAPNIIGRDIDQLQIHITGAAYVKMVGVKVESNTPHRNNSIAVQVQQRFQGSQRVSLAQLLRNVPRLDMQRPLESITIIARGHGNIMAAGAGRGQGGINVTGPTTQSLQVIGYATASDYMLRVSGNLVIETLRIKFR